MSTGDKKDFHGRVEEYLPITLFGSKINVGVIGGGKAAFLKIKTFIKKGCKIEILSRGFCEEINDIKLDNLVLIKGEYTKDFLKDKHLIIIAIDEKNIIENIVNDCNYLFKIYINSNNFKAGMGAVPVVRESNNIILSVNSKLGNPKGAIMVADRAINATREYEEFIVYSSKLRDNIKKLGNLKEELLNFVVSEDFKVFYDKGKDVLVLNLFYSEEVVNKIITLDNEV